MAYKITMDRSDGTQHPETYAYPSLIAAKKAARDLLADATIERDEPRITDILIYEGPSCVYHAPVRRVGCPVFRAIAGE